MEDTNSMPMPLTPSVGILGTLELDMSPIRSRMLPS